MLDRKRGVSGDNMMGLNYGERFIIWSIRRIITERGPDGRLLDECMSIFEQDGEAGLEILSVFLGLLGRSARRRFEVGAPEHLFTTWDERQILTLLGAAQGASAQAAVAQAAAAQAENVAGHSVLLEAHLRWISKPLHRPDLAQAALTLGRLLDVHGHRIVLEMAAPPDQRVEGVKLTVVAQAGGDGVSGLAKGWTAGASATRPA